MRPGITGWAQVNGGRIISDPDKWILDIWYVQNASLLVDFKIILGTVKMVLFGDRINAEAIRQAKSDLGLKTLLPADRCSPFGVLINWVHPIFGCVAPGKSVVACVEMLEQLLETSPCGSSPKNPWRSRAR